MAAKLDKSKMACNKPRRSPNPKKKKVVKACSGGKEKSFILVRLDTVIIIVLPLENHFVQGTTVAQLQTN